MALDSSLSVDFAPFIVTAYIYCIYIYNYTSREAHFQWASLLQRVVDGILVKVLCIKRSLGKSQKWKGDMRGGLALC